MIFLFSPGGTCELPGGQVNREMMQFDEHVLLLPPGEYLFAFHHISFFGRENKVYCTWFLAAVFLVLPVDISYICVFRSRSLYPNGCLSSNIAEAAMLADQTTKTSLIFPMDTSITIMAKSCQIAFATGMNLP